jgi:hypothetical protein
MALGEAARFATLGEAEIACSALNAAGLRAVVFDNALGSMVWTQQFMLGGCRLMAPATQLADARLLLRECRSFEPEALKWGHHPERFSGLPLAFLALLLGPYIGWTIAALRMRFTLIRLAVVTILFGSYAVIYAVIFLHWGE